MQVSRKKVKDYLNSITLSERTIADAMQIDTRIFRRFLEGGKLKVSNYVRLCQVLGVRYDLFIDQ